MGLLLRPRGVYDTMQHMKKGTVIVQAVAMSVLMAGVGSAQEELWTLRTPDTGMLPSYARVVYVSRMGERHGGSHLGMQEYSANIPLADGRKSHIGKWYYNVQANVGVSVMDVGGRLDLRRDELYDFSVPVSIVRPLEEGKRAMLTLMPRYAGDNVSSARAWDLGVSAEYDSKVSDTFAYGLGLAASPRFSEQVVIPYFLFRWMPSPEWLIRMRGGQLAALYKVRDNLHVGPALCYESGTWMVASPRGQRVFRVRTLAFAGVMEYNFSRPNSPKKMLNLAAGMSLATTAAFCQRSIGRDTIKMYHYKPGAFLSAELDFRF